MSTPTPDSLPNILSTLATWQVDSPLVHLHPGDIGWHTLQGVEKTAQHLRIWSDNGEAVAVGMLDGPTVFRLAIKPSHLDDITLAQAVLDDCMSTTIFSGSEAVLEARNAHAVGSECERRRWTRGELWTPLTLDLAKPFEPVHLPPGVTVQSVGPDQAEEWMATHWSAFRTTPMTAEDRRRSASMFRNLLAGPAGSTALPLALMDREMAAVIIVWSAGEGRPGLLEPLAVHPGFRRRGYGRTVVQAATQALRDRGSSSIVVCTDTARESAVATYRSAGFTEHAPVADWIRPPLPNH